MKEIKPKQQGDLDSLCGVHAVVNALYAHQPTLSNRDLSRLFRALLRHAEKHSKRPLRILWKGIDATLLERLLRRGSRQLASSSARFKRKRLKPARDQALSEALRRVQKKLDAGWLAIVSVTGKEDHWTVIRRITPERIYLIDSSRYKYLRIRDCALKPTKGKYVLFSDDILLVRRVDKRPDASGRFRIQARISPLLSPKHWRSL